MTNINGIHFKNLTKVFTKVITTKTIRNKLSELGYFLEN